MVTDKTKPISKHLITGKKGEAKAISFLKSLKYEIIGINYKNNIGEIDVICMDKDYYVFVEVKARMSLKYGRPSEAVGYFKQNKVKNIATSYLIKKGVYPCPVRFDVIEILNGEILSHIKNAF